MISPNIIPVNPKPLTTKQQRLWYYYTDASNWKLVPPTYKDCKKYIGAKSDNSVHKLLKSIQEAGYSLKPRNQDPLTTQQNG